MRLPPSGRGRSPRPRGFPGHFLSKRCCGSRLAASRRQAEKERIEPVDVQEPQWAWAGRRAQAAAGQRDSGTGPMPSVPSSAGARRVAVVHAAGKGSRCDNGDRTSRASIRRMQSIASNASFCGESLAMVGEILHRSPLPGLEAPAGLGRRALRAAPANPRARRPDAAVAPSPGLVGQVTSTPRPRRNQGERGRRAGAPRLAATGCAARPHSESKARSCNGRASSSCAPRPVEDARGQLAHVRGQHGRPVRARRPRTRPGVGRLGGADDAGRCAASDLKSSKAAPRPRERGQKFAPAQRSERGLRAVGLDQPTERAHAGGGR